MWGADVNQLRTLAQSLQTASDQLVTTTSQVSGLVEASMRWQGGDADQFRGEWTGTSVALLRGVSQTLAEASRAVQRNADEQFGTSTEGGSLPSPGVPGPGGPGAPGGPGMPSGPGGGPLGPVDRNALGVLGAVGLGAHGLVGVGLDAAKFIPGIGIARQFLQAGPLDDLAALRSSAVTAGLGRFTVNHFGMTAARSAGALGGVFGIIGGANQIFNSDYADQGGWRHVTDQAMGGLSIIGGAGSIALAAGLLTNPVGITVVVGAGLVAGAWSLGNYVYDNREAIGEFFGDMGGYVSEGWDEATDFASDAVDNIGDAASDAVGAIGDGLSKAGDFVGGLFS